MLPPCLVNYIAIQVCVNIVYTLSNFRCLVEHTFTFISSACNLGNNKADNIHEKEE